MRGTWKRLSSAVRTVYITRPPVADEPLSTMAKKDPSAGSRLPGSERPAGSTVTSAPRSSGLLRSHQTSVTRKEQMEMRRE